MTNLANDEAVASPTQPNRDSMRAAIFASQNKKLKSKVISFFGQDVEIRQPKLGSILDAREEEDRQAAVINTLVEYTYVPGTDIKLFDDADADAFKEMPFGKDFLAVNKTLEELTEVNFLDKKPASKGTDSNT